MAKAWRESATVHERPTAKRQPADSASRVVGALVRSLSGGAPARQVWRRVVPSPDYSGGFWFW